MILNCRTVGCSVVDSLLFSKGFANFMQAVIFEAFFFMIKTEAKSGYAVA